MIPVGRGIEIDESEIEESFIRASGPGGQHVNTSSTAVQIRFDARRSRSLPNDVAMRLMKLAGSRLTRDGVIVITAESQRSQRQNREEARERLIELIAKATERPVVRRPTKPSKTAKRKRLETKAKRATVKAGRSRPTLD